MSHLSALVEEGDGSFTLELIDQWKRVHIVLSISSYRADMGSILCFLLLHGSRFPYCAKQLIFVCGD